MVDELTIEIDIKKEGRVAPALRRGLQDGLEEAGEDLLDKGKDRARDAVMGVRVWNEQVKRGFETRKNQFSRQDHWQGYIFNPVKHADVVDRGLAPAGEITGSNPSVQDIMPWVVSELSPADYGGGDGSTPFTPGGDGGDAPGSITDPDRTVQYGDLSDLGLRADSFESARVKAGSLGDGTNVVWKSHPEETDTTIQEWKRGVVRNEVVWSQAQELLGEDLGPKSRVTTEDTIQGEISGTMQEYVPGKQLAKKLFVGFGDPDDKEYTRDEFLRENLDWAAKTAAIDYIVGNGDRHKNNVRVTPDGEPRNIDNGGNQFNEELSGAHLMFVSDFKKYEHAVNEDELLDANMDFLDRVEAVLDNIVADEDYRQALIAKTAEVHGFGSREHERMKRIIGEEVGVGHILDEDDRETPIYKLHVDAAREWHQYSYDTGDSFRRSEYVVELDPDDDGEPEPDITISDDERAEEFNNEIDSIMNDFLGDDDNEE